MSLGTRDFRLLTVLAKELLFGRSAESLGMRQPQLSTRLAQIERNLGVVLFVRRPRVSLTPAGRMIVDAARRAFNEFDAAVTREIKENVQQVTLLERIQTLLKANLCRSDRFHQTFRVWCPQIFASQETGTDITR